MATQARNSRATSSSDHKGLSLVDIWKPQAGPQLMACTCPFDVILFGGARGGGKTDCALGRQIIGALRYGHAWNGLFIRKSFKYFAELRRRIDHMIRAGLPAVRTGGDQSTNYLTFENGARVTLTVIETIEKAEFFQGQQFCEISIEEGGQFSFFIQMLELMKGCMRSPFGLKCTTFVTANPGGPGHNQVKNTFMPTGVLPMTPIVDEAGITYIYIPSRVEDNKILCENDPKYVKMLRSIKDPELRKAWLDGNWDVALGGYFADSWNNFKHIVNQFRPPAHWPRIVGMDWGSSTPFSIGWYAVADGVTPIPELDGRVFRKNTLIRYFEWYGCPKGHVNTGLRLDSETVAERMLELEKRYRLIEDCIEVDRVADPSIFSVKDGPSIAEKMSGKGVVFRAGDNKRIAGWNIIRGLLSGETIGTEYNVEEKEDGTFDHVFVNEEKVPMFYVTRNCTEFYRTFPFLERDPHDFEDVNTDDEDHAADEFRYVATSRYERTTFFKPEEHTTKLLDSTITRLLKGGEISAEAIDALTSALSANGEMVSSNIYIAR